MRASAAPADQPRRTAPGRTARRRPAPPRAARALVLLVLAIFAGACTGAEDPAVGAGPTGADGAADAPTAARAGVSIEVGDVWQEVVDAQPPGTTFLIAAGEHRGATVVPRDGDRFVGEEGAVMTGAVVVDGWVQDGDLWVADGYEADGEPLGELLEGWAQQGYRQELFLDGERLTHVDVRDNVRPGFWWFDREGSRLVVADDPTDRLVELSDVEAAFSGPGTRDVHIEGLEVRMYGSPSQGAAIDGDVTVDWTVEDVHVHRNHAAGIRVDRGTLVTGSLIEANGQIGINGAEEDGEGRPIVIVDNEIRDNTPLNFVWFWETGGVKLTYADGAVVQGNVVTGNGGPGIWYDLDCFDGVITDNEVHDNSAVGIFYEISEGGTISGNAVTGNGFGIGPEFASGIWLSNSGQTKVVGNTLSGNTNEVLVVAAPREEFGFPVTGNLIADNDITITDGFVGLSVVTDQPELYSPDANQWRTNDYTLDGCEPCFFWEDRVDAATWLSLGNDLDSTFTGPAAEGLDLPVRPTGGPLTGAGEGGAGEGVAGAGGAGEDGS